MPPRRLFRLFAYATLYLASQLVLAKPIEIVLWHSLSDQAAITFKHIVENFNKSQITYAIKPIYKGEYTEVITSFAAAFRAKQAPAIVQIYEVGTATMLQPKGIIKPVDELMQEANIPLPKKDFFTASRTFYSQNNRLLALPFNTSVPVIYYNVDALAKIGYSKKNFPITWQEMEILAAKLQQAHFVCAYTTAYPAWIHIESFAALHSLNIIDEQQYKAIYNNKAIIKHLQRLRRWQLQHYFEYGGRTNDATVLFTSGRCPLFSQSSGGYNALKKLVPFKLGVAAMPLDSTISSVRHNNLIGGAALWVVTGHDYQVYPGIARFFSYLAQANVQQQWYQGTGYLPLGITGNYTPLTTNNRHPILRIAQIDLMHPHNESIKFTPWPQNLIRVLNEDAIEAIFSGSKTPTQAMNAVIQRANYALLRFGRNTHFSHS